MIYFFQEILAQKDKTVNQQIIVAYLRKFLKTKLSGQMVCTSGQTIFLSGQSCLRLSKHLIYQAVYISVSALRFSVSTKLKQLVRSFTQSQSVPWPWKTCPKLLNHMSPDPSTPQNKSCKYLAQIFSFWDIAKIFSKWWSLTAVGFFVCFFFFQFVLVFWPHHSPAPQPEIKPTPPALEAWRLNHWSLHKFNKHLCFIKKLLLRDNLGEQGGSCKSVRKPFKWKENPKAVYRGGR